MLTDERDGDEPPVARHALKDVQTLIQATTVEAVEDLREHKRVKHKRGHPLISLVVTEA